MANQCLMTSVVQRREARGKGKRKTFIKSSRETARLQIGSENRIKKEIIDITDTKQTEEASSATYLDV